MTPYDKALNIKEDDFARQVDHIYEAGCDGIVIGQVSELLRLDSTERHRLAELAVCCNANRGSVVVSTGAESTKNAVDYSVHAQDIGADCILLMHPTTTALPEEELYEYFKEVIVAIDIPVMIHHAKSYAKWPVSVHLQARLLEEFGNEKVFFKPESSPTPPKLTLLRDLSSNKARVFEGDGGMMLLDCYRRGLAGTIPAADTAEIVATLWRLLEEKEYEEAELIAYPLSYLMCIMMNSVDCYQTIAKHSLKRMGIFEYDIVRPPMDYIPDKETLKEVDRVMDLLVQRARQAKCAR